MTQRCIVIILKIVIAALLVGCRQNDSRVGGLTPEQALRSFQIAEGFRIDLVASEPLISDPVAMEIDENGNLYVVEMHGYPLDTKGSGIIKLLTDTDHDGRPDHSTVFADSLVLPTGIMRWKRGMLVTDPPNVIYFEDTNGDQRADIRKIVLTGFALSNPQHNANNPYFNLDNWIYIAHQGKVTPKVFVREFGDEGSTVRFPGDPNVSSLPQNANGRSIRFKPDSHELEMLSSWSQFGQTFDPWGHLFETSNAEHLFTEVLAARYFRNPNVPIENAIQHIPDHGDAAEVFPITKKPQHQLLTDVGVITSSCGVTWYGGNLFPESFNRVSFIAEPVHNLVHADRITDEGVSFKASRVYEKKEFLASTDAWFRPVNFYVGPDGALYVIDYYRQIIEHPEWMSEEAVQSGALYNGSDLGRIYRIAPLLAANLSWSNNLNLGHVSTRELVSLLGHKNIWWRRNAQRLLLDRQSDSIVALVNNFLHHATTPAGLVHGLWLLEGLKKSDPVLLTEAMRHPVAGVRENAVRIAELHLHEFPSLKPALLTLQRDPHPRVRFQTLCTLGFLSGSDVQAARENILEQNLDDYWVQMAALNSSPGIEQELLDWAVRKFQSTETSGARSFLKNCASVIALSRNTPAIRRTILMAMENKKDSWWQTALLDGLSQGLKELGSPLPDLGDQQERLASMIHSTDVPKRRAAILLLEHIGLGSASRHHFHEAAVHGVLDTTQNLAYREDALRLLKLTHEPSDVLVLKTLLTPQQPESLQLLALDAYRALSPDQASRYLVNDWKTLTPVIRNRAVDIFLTDSVTVTILLDALEQNKIQATALHWPRMVELMYDDHPSIRRRARKILASGDSRVDEVVASYRSALSRDGDPVKGLLVFKNNCSICHRIGGNGGTAFGPDLGTIRNREKEFILMDILNPNRSIADGYELWKVVRIDGDEMHGIIASETATAITVRFASGEDHIVQRSDIAELVAEETSAMPVGLDKSISVDQMTDLLEFLKSGGSR